MDWLQNHIWPAEGKRVSDEFVYDGTLIGMAEMIRSGTTTVNDMYFLQFGRGPRQSGCRHAHLCRLFDSGIPHQLRPERR